MSTPFDVVVPGYRFVLSNHGDTMRDVALRELGDASQWTKLVAINALQPPYLTDDPLQVTPAVALNGTDYIAIPTAVPPSNQDANDAFGTDIMLTPNGLLATNGAGDFATVSGLDNLRQALRNALATDEGELIMHPKYGTLIRRILGTVVGPTSTVLAADYARQTIEADERIQSVITSNAVGSSDSITVKVFAQTVNGQTVEAQEKL